VTPRPAGIFTVDVEDWAQAVLDHSLPVTRRFVEPTRRIAALLERHGASGTFFFLGSCAAAAPDLVRELAAAGHEIQTHGWDHTPLHEIGGPDGLREDLRRARAVIEDLIGQPVCGYRAPRFSIDHRTLWAVDVLAELGFVYDASIFPMRLRGYGIPHWPAAPHFLRTPGGHTLIEFPVSVGRCCGVPLPAGGGYFRLAPRWAIDRAFPCLPTGMAGPLFSPEPQASACAALPSSTPPLVPMAPFSPEPQASACAAPPSSTPPLVPRAPFSPEPQASACAALPSSTPPLVPRAPFSPEPQASACAALPSSTPPLVPRAPLSPEPQASACAALPSSTPPLVLYCHPQEFDPEGLRALGPDVHVPWRLRWHQGWGRRAYEEKVGALLSRIPFRPVRDLLPLGTRGSPRP
jgi:polysaccharide deacetylase family protein (PEP-CTERM system associated)